MAGLFGDHRDAAHEGAADTEDVNVHAIGQSQDRDTLAHRCREREKGSSARRPELKGDELVDELRSHFSCTRAVWPYVLRFRCLQQAPLVPARETRERAFDPTARAMTLNSSPISAGLRSFCACRGERQIRCGMIGRCARHQIGDAQR